MPDSPSAPPQTPPLPSPKEPMTPDVRAAYSRLIGTMRGAKYAAARAAAKAAAVEEARAEFDRLRAGQDAAA